QTLFYEYQDLASLADFLLENSPEQVTAFAGIASAARVAVLAPVPVDTRPVRDDVLDYLVASIIDATKLDAGEVRPATQLSDYGLDSMMILALNGKLAATFGEVSQTLFY
ncbi:acyl carrier protein, partial [Dickeya fangzhongdai]